MDNAGARLQDTVLGALNAAAVPFHGAKGDRDIIALLNDLLPADVMPHYR